MSTVHSGRLHTAAEQTGSAGEFRRRLLDGLVASIAETGYRRTTIADIVRHARTSRRTFYEYFPGKDACFTALITESDADLIDRIYAAVDPGAPWRTQIRQAVEAWIASMESAKPIALSWIRDVPSLGTATRRMQRDAMESFITMVQTLCDTEEFRAAGVAPVSRQRAIMLLGGLRELAATTVEDGGRISDVTETAVQASIGLLAPPSTG